MSKNPRFEIESLITKCETELNNFLTLDASHFSDFSALEKQMILSELTKWKDVEFGNILKDFTVEQIKIPKNKIDGISYPTPEFVKKNLENLKNNLLIILTNTIENSGCLLNSANSIGGLNEQNCKEISKFNYLDYLHEIEQEIDKNKDNTIDLTVIMCKLWIIRNYLCYILLCYATFLFENETEFTSIIANRKYIKEIGEKIYLFELGIFGSYNTTSDIDIGIRYIGNDTMIGLSYIISVVEDLFHLFIGVENSLALDIEPYADMYILPNWDEKTKRKYPDMFFLNTSYFEEKDLKIILPYIYASIIRNYIKGNDELLQSVKKNKEIDIPLHLMYKTPSPKEQKDVNNNTFISKYLDTTKYRLSFMNGRDMALTYMRASYNESREIYYKKVNNAETLLTPIRIQINISQINNNNLVTNISKIELKKKDVLECMKRIMESLIYRQESYVCPATITHVVRTIQVKSENNDVCSFDTNTQQLVIPTNKAICAIGKYGYIMSALEQYGFLIRFHNLYCIEGTYHYNKYNCFLKYTKYNERLISAKDGYEKTNQKQSPTWGGIVKMSRKHSIKRNKTRKHSIKRNKTR
jgi:predicted nucleotidyltransferase